MSGSYPHFAEKHSFRSLITPERHLEYVKTVGRYPSKPAPHTFIFCYQGRFLETVLQNYRHETSDGCFSKVYFLSDYPGVAIADFGIGAPAVALKLELLIAWGVKRFVSIGTAGGLQKNIGIGDIIVCDRAIRDEGTSHHYLPYAK